MVEERHNPDTIRCSSSCDVATQSCDSRGNINRKFTAEKSCKCFKAKDFWKLYGSVIVKWCHASPNSPPSSHPPPPHTTTHSSSSSSSCTSCDGNKANFEEAEPSSSRVEEGENPNRVSKQKSKEKDEFLRAITAPLSRIASRISPASSPKSKSVAQVSSFVSRCISSRKTTTNADRNHNNDHDQQQYFNSPAPASLSREASHRISASTATMTATPRNVALSRNASQNPATSASPASLSREASQRISASTATTTPRNVALSRNASQNPATSASPASLSREASQRISASTATMTTPRNVSLSRNASQNPATSASPASSLSREASQRSAGTATTTTTPRNNAFSRNASQRSTAQIMFSNSTGRRVKPPPVQKNLECTLEELFFGCTKKVKVTRDVLTDRGQIVQEEEVLSIQVKPGWKRGTKITFEDMGNERLGAQPADVTFVIVEKGHPLFRREGDDLELTIGIPLVQALTGCDISIPLMGNSGETMNLMIEDIIYPGYQKTVSGQGMPKAKEEEEGERGDLRVLFLVEFPVELTEEQRSEVVSILEGSS